MTSKENNNADLGLLLGTFLMVQLPNFSLPTQFSLPRSLERLTHGLILPSGRHCLVACILHLTIKPVGIHVHRHKAL